MLTGPLKPLAEGLSFGGGVTALVTEAEADCVVYIGRHRVGDKVPGLSGAAHVVAAKGGFGNTPDGVGVVQHIVGIFKIGIIEQGAVIAKLLSFLHGGGAPSISAAGRPAQHGKAPFYHGGLSTGQVLVAILMLIGDTAALGGGLLLWHRAGVGENHELIQAQFFLRALPVGDLKSDVPRLVGDAKFVAGHILVILHTGVHVAVGDGGLPCFAIGTHRNPGLVGAQCQVGRTKGGSDAADAVFCTQIHGEQGDGLIIAGAVGKIAARYTPVAFIGVHIAAVGQLAFGQHHRIVLFQNVQQVICMVKVSLDRQGLGNLQVVDGWGASPIVRFHLSDFNSVCIGVTVVRDRHFQVVGADFGHIHFHIALAIQLGSVHPYRSGLGLGKRVDLNGVHREIGGGGILCDLGCKSDVVGLHPLGVITYRF